MSIGPGMFVDQFSGLARAPSRHLDGPGGPGRQTGCGTAHGRSGAACPAGHPQIACRPIVMQITMADPVPLAGSTRWKEVLAVPQGSGPTSTATRRGGTCRAAASDLVAPLVEDRRGGHQTRQDVTGVPSTSSRGGHRLDPVRPAPRPRPRRRGEHPLQVVLDNDGDDEVGDNWPTSARCSACPLLSAHASQLCDAPATRPTCSATGSRRRHAVAGGGAVWRLTGHHPTPSASPTGDSCGPATSPTWSPSTPTPWATPVERVADQPAAPTACWCAPTGVEHLWVNGCAPRADGEGSPAPPRPPPPAPGRGPDGGFLPSSDPRLLRSTLVAQCACMRPPWRPRSRRTGPPG